MYNFPMKAPRRFCFIHSRMHISLGLYTMAVVCLVANAQTFQADHAPRQRSSERWSGPRVRSYTVTEVGDSAMGINNRGQVVGAANNHAFLWQDGRLNDLGTLGGSASSATAINDRGQVVGGSDTSVVGNVNQHGFLWDGCFMTDLGTLGGPTAARGINERGQVVGISYTGAGNHAFLWQSGTISDLGTLSGGGFSSASGINERGQIVGTSDRTNGGQDAFLWRHGQMRDLGIAERNDTYANAINDKGEVVGGSIDGRSQFPLDRKSTR